MSKGDPLFELIYSLSKSEKRYFKLYSLRHTVNENNNSVKLFNIIEKRRGGSDNDKGTIDFSSVKNIRFVKHYLHKQILKSLVAFHSRGSVKSTLRDQLHCIEILLEKKLITQAEKLVQQTKILAQKNEQYFYLAEATKFEIEINSMTGYKGKSLVDVDRIYADFDELFDLSKNLLSYRQLSDHFFLNLYKNARMSDETKISGIKKLMKSPLMKSKNKALSNYALLRFYRCNCVYYFLMCDYNKVSEYVSDEIELIEHKAQFIKEAPDYLFTSYCNLFVAKFYNHDFKEVPAVLEKLKSLQAQTVAQKENNLIMATLFEIGYYNALGQFNKAVEIAAKNRRKMELILEKDKQRAMEFYYCLGYAYMGLNNYKLSNQHLQKIMDVSFKGIGEDMYCLTRIILLINYYEMGKMDLLEYAAKSLYKFLLQKDHLYKFEKVLLEFVKDKLPIINNKRTLIVALKTIRNELEEIAKDKFENKSFLRFDFLSWLESKIAGRPFAETIRTRLPVKR